MRNFNTLEFNEYPILTLTDLDKKEILSLENTLDIPNGEVLNIETIDYDCKGYTHVWTVNIKFVSGGSTKAIINKVEYNDHFDVVKL